MRRALAGLLLGLAAGAAAAQTVALSGQFGDSKALLLIDGAPATVTVGDTVRGVKLRSLRNGQAEVEVGGKVLLLSPGGSASVGSGRGTGAGGTSITIPMGTGGHFETSGAINGRPVQFLVDTGATVISMGVGDAERIGLDWRRGQRAMSQTAGGVVPIYLLNLTSVRVGEVEVFNVNAAVLQADMPSILLGNSFLGRFSMRRDADVLRLEKR
jgi:aspartyl protease family protein